MIDDEIPVFDRRETPCVLPTKEHEWRPPRLVNARRGNVIPMAGDPLPKIFLSIAPDHEVDLFCRNGAAWYSSQGFRGQAANDNKDWPLEKLLTTEKNEFCLSLARRYRALHDAATGPVQLIGREAENLYVVHKEDSEGNSKGVKVLTGEKANIDTAATHSKSLSLDTKKRSAPVAKKWNGDLPILDAIDARRELAYIRAKLAFAPKILEGFEWAVVDGLTLAEIGERLGAGSKGGKGEARARIFDGFGIVDRYWQRGDAKRAKAANDNLPCATWERGKPLPAGYYRSRLHPDMIFPRSLGSA